MKCELINFKSFGDERGQLVALENNKEIPFEIKRIYYIFGNVLNLRRGFHAHKRLKQVLICVNGSCTIHVDDGNETNEILLDNPTKGLLIDSTIWREMYNFSKDAVLLVLASEKYSSDDYLRDYDEFLKYIGGKND